MIPSEFLHKYPEIAALNLNLNKGLGSFKLKEMLACIQCVIASMNALSKRSWPSDEEKIDVTAVVKEKLSKAIAKRETFGAYLCNQLKKEANSTGSGHLLCFVPFDILDKKPKDFLELERRYYCGELDQESLHILKKKDWQLLKTSHESRNLLSQMSPRFLRFVLFELISPSSQEYSLSPPVVTVLKQHSPVADAAEKLKVFGELFMEKHADFSRPIKCLFLARLLDVAYVLCQSQSPHLLSLLQREVSGTKNRFRPYLTKGAVQQWIPSGFSLVDGMQSSDFAMTKSEKKAWNFFKSDF